MSTIREELTYHIFTLYTFKIYKNELARKNIYSTNTCFQVSTFLDSMTLIIDNDETIEQMLFFTSKFEVVLGVNNHLLLHELN